MKAVAALFAVLLAHYFYEPAAWLSGGDLEKAASWWAFVFRGIEGVILCWLLLPMFQSMKGWQRTVGIFAIALGIFEEGQTAVCGALTMHSIIVPFGSTLCVERFGSLPYLAAIALALTLIFRGISKK